MAEAGLLELENLEWREFLTQQDSQIQLALHGTCFCGPNRPPSFNTEFRALIDVSEVIFEGRDEMLPELGPTVRPLSPHCTANVTTSNSIEVASESVLDIAFCSHSISSFGLGLSHHLGVCIAFFVAYLDGQEILTHGFSSPLTSMNYDSSHILHRQWQTPPQNLQKMFKLK